MQIPKNAKRVFKGIIFDTYQWQQKMFDKTYETFEMLKRPDTVEIIAAIGDKILICEQQQPNTDIFYSLFGGRVDQNEKPINAAKRELLEESGYSSNNWELIDSYEPYSKMEWTIYTFVAKNCKKEANQKLDAGEKIKILLVNFEKFIKIIESKKFRNKNFYHYIYQIKQDKNKLNEFKKKLFG